MNKIYWLSINEVKGYPQLTANIIVSNFNHSKALVKYFGSFAKTGKLLFQQT